ncbi:MAG: hypothetical protein CL840_07605 [Crocinitomicaceae bacterium]|nr:hypothetical protein [Crocinitomicaceae bacterium]|tara:strand:+ start:13839 stop:14261 length:423 start_codon:yes stop_codon:yes gene_type:complete
MALTNNDIIKKLRVALKLRDTDIVKILKLVDYDTTTSEIGAFFRSEDHPKYKPLQDQILRNFLNGLVIYKRGPMDRKSSASAKASGDTRKKPAQTKYGRPRAFESKEEKVPSVKHKRSRPRIVGTINRKKRKDNSDSEKD